MSRPRPKAPLLAVLAGGLSCGGPVPGPTWTLGPAEACGAAALVYAYDPDGDGIDELVRVEGELREGTRLVWSGGGAPLPAHPQRALAVDLDGDGHQRLLLAVGAGPGAAGAPLQLLELGRAGLVERWRHAGPRGQATELRAVGGEVFLAHFDDERAVVGGFWSPDGLRAPQRAHMGMRQAPLADGRRVIGRLYGEEPRSDGDLHLLSPDGAEARLPSLRGVRALAVANLDEDDAEEVIVGDGWHAEYGQRALARLRLLDGPDLSEGRTIAVIDGSYAVLDVTPVGAGPEACLLVHASHGATLLCRDPLGWAAQPVGPLSEAGNVALLRQADGFAVATADGQCRLRPLRRTRSTG
jgi:hypothetical protein